MLQFCLRPVPLTRSLSLCVCGSVYKIRPLEDLVRGASLGAAFRLFDVEICDRAADSARAERFINIFRFSTARSVDSLSSAFPHYGVCGQEEEEDDGRDVWLLSLEDEGELLLLRTKA